MSKIEIILDPPGNPSTLIEGVKRVFSTNVFIPMNPELTDKSFTYFTGFVKLVETFKVRTKFYEKEQNNKWYLYVYYDKMFDDKYVDSNYTYADSNNRQNKDIKKSFLQYKDSLIKLHKLYKLYIEHIKKNENNKYNFIKLISFDVTNVVKKNKGYLGNPMTLGSMIRFEPFYDNDLDYVFCINISHAITPNLMKLVDQWVGRDEDILGIDSRVYTFANLKKHHVFFQYDILEDLLDENPNLLGENPNLLGENPNLLKEYSAYFKTEKRFPASLFGYKPKETSQLEKYIDILNNIIQYIKLLIALNTNEIMSEEESKYKIFEYGIDEIILSIIIKNLNIDYKNIYEYNLNNDNNLFQHIQCAKYPYYYEEKYPIQKKNALGLKQKGRVLSCMTIQQNLLNDVLYKKIKTTESPEVLKKLDLKENTAKSSFFFDNFINCHKNLGRKLVRDIFGTKMECTDTKTTLTKTTLTKASEFTPGETYEKIIIDYFREVYNNPENNNFITLFNGFDEVKPLFIFIGEPPDIYSSLIEYFTFYNITNEKITELFKKILNYYTNAENILLNPYPTQVGQGKGKGKSKKTSKKRGRWKSLRKGKRKKTSKKRGWRSPVKSIKKK